jgi:hypothetical protein
MSSVKTGSYSNSHSRPSSGRSSRITEEFDDDDYLEVDTQQIRAAQIKRNARNKGKSKLMHKFKGLGEGEDKEAMLRFKRIGDGIRTILGLHNPVELSSISGTLNLSVQEKGTTSIENIVRFCVENNEFAEDKMVRVVASCWEGALFEYLKSVGYPLVTCFSDPKPATMKILRRGLFADGAAPFTPHYICKRVAPRYDWIQSEDLTSKLSKLREVELLVKRTEKEVMEEDDYTNMLLFLQKMHELRRLETEFRNYSTGELEIARAKLDRAECNEKMARDMVVELERRYMLVSDDLNKSLAYRESVSEELASEKILLDTQLRRLRKMLESCRMATAARCEGRSPLDAPMVAPISVIHDVKDCFKSVRDLHNDVLDFKKTSDKSDNEMRSFIRKQDEEITSLKETIQGLSYDSQCANERAKIATAREKKAIEEVTKVARDIVRREQHSDASRKVTWETSVRWANRAQNLEEKLRKFYPAIKSAIFAGDEGAIAYALAMNKSFGIVPTAEVAQWQETYKMDKEDDLAEEIREAEQEEIRKAAAEKLKAAKGKKGGKGKAGGAKGKGKSASPSRGPSKDPKKKGKASASPAPKSPKKGGSKSPAKKKK